MKLPGLYVRREERLLDSDLQKNAKYGIIKIIEAPTPLDEV